MVRDNRWIDEPAHGGQDILRYAELQYTFVQFLSEHLADCRRVFNGDLDAVLVFAVLWRNHLRALLNQTGKSAAAPAMSASRLSDVTGVPRETVRRKLNRFSQNGWIEQNAGGAWRLNAKDGASTAQRDLTEIDQRGCARFLRLHADITRILDRRKDG